MVLVSSFYIFARLCGRSDVELEKCLIPNFSSTQATSKDTWFFFPKFVPKNLLRSSTSDLLILSSLFGSFLIRPHLVTFLQGHAACVDVGFFLLLSHAVRSSLRIMASVLPFLHLYQPS